VLDGLLVLIIGGAGSPRGDVRAQPRSRLSARGVFDQRPRDLSAIAATTR
jgi:hypothetical protein